MSLLGELFPGDFQYLLVSVRTPRVSNITEILPTVINRNSRKLTVV